MIRSKNDASRNLEKSIAGIVGKVKTGMADDARGILQAALDRFESGIAVFESATA